MKASRKKTKTRGAKKTKTTKVKKATAKKTTAKKANVKKVAPSAAPATATVAPPQDKRDVGSLIKKLDVSSLHHDDLTTILKHANATLDFRKVIDDVDAPLTRSSSNYCYTKSGASSTVSIWQDGFKVGETSQADAEARGIKPCG